MKGLHSFIATTLLIFICVCHVNPLTMHIGANREECFYEDVKKGDPVTLNFHVSSGGFMDLDVKIIAPDDRVIYSGERETEGKYSFTAENAGVYAFCFSNKMSTYTPKTVTFGIVVGSGKETFGFAKADRLSPLETSIVHLSDGLVEIQAQQKYMRLRERAHRHTTESTNARVLWWSFLEAAVLIAMSLWQIYYLRSFFEVKRVV